MPALLDAPPAAAPHGLARWGRLRTAGDPTLDSLDKLNDLSLWHVVENVPILKEHTKKLQRPKRDADGNPVLDAQGRPEQEPVEFVCDLDKLHEIADVNNLREEATADVCPIMVGHIRKDTPEIELGEVVGYQRTYHVGTFGPQATPALLTTWQLRPDKVAMLREQGLVRRSVELWPGSLVIDPVCVLKRTPELDLGVLFYARDSLHYQQESPVDNTQQASGAAQQSEELAPEHKQIADAYMAHYERNHPVMRYMKSCYEKDNAGGESESEPGKEVPVQNDASLSGTNGAVPAPEPEKKARDSAGNGWNNNKEQRAAAARMTEEGDWDSKQEHAKKGTPMTNARNGPATQYARLEADNRDLRARLDALSRDREEAKCRLVLKDLADDGYKINYAKDVAALLPLTDAQRVEYAKELREERVRAERPPTGGLLRTEAPVGTYARAGEDPMSEARLDECVQYAKVHPEASWDEVKEKAPRRK